MGNRFAWSDDDVEFRDDNGTVLTKQQVEEMQAKADSDRASGEAMAADQREQLAARETRQRRR